MVKIKKDLSLRNKIKRSGKNQKMMWKNLNKILPIQKKNVASSEIVFESGPTTNEIEISNKFNDFFIKSIIDINSQIPNGSEIADVIIPYHFFKFSHVLTQTNVKSSDQ